MAQWGFFVTPGLRSGAVTPWAHRQDKGGTTIARGSLLKHGCFYHAKLRVAWAEEGNRASLWARVFEQAIVLLAIGAKRLWLEVVDPKTAFAKSTFTFQGSGSVSQACHSYEAAAHAGATEVRCTDVNPTGNCRWATLQDLSKAREF